MKERSFFKKISFQKVATRRTFWQKLFFFTWWFGLVSTTSEARPEKRPRMFVLLVLSKNIQSSTTARLLPSPSPHLCFSVDESVTRESFLSLYLLCFLPFFCKFSFSFTRTSEPEKLKGKFSMQWQWQTPYISYASRRARWWRCYIFYDPKSVVQSVNIVWWIPSLGRASSIKGRRGRNRPNRNNR